VGKKKLGISLREIYTSLFDLYIYPGKIHKSLPEIYISLKEIHKSLKEIWFSPVDSSALTSIS